MSRSAVEASAAKKSARRDRRKMPMIGSPTPAIRGVKKTFSIDT
jgi:hypothetical protein